jgi:hypothetical protein
MKKLKSNRLSHLAHGETFPTPAQARARAEHTAKPDTKKHRTSSKHVRELVRAHILESVTDGNGDTFPALPGAIAHLKAEFDRVANYPANLRRIPNDQDRFRDYLMGLPFGFEFTQHGIAEFLNGLGINPEGKEFDPEKSAHLYAYLIYRELA